MEKNIWIIWPWYKMHTKYLKVILGKKASKDYVFRERFTNEC